MAAGTATSQKAPVKIGNQTFPVQTIITDRGANNFLLDVYRFNSNDVNGTRTLIAQSDAKGILRPTSSASSAERAELQSSNSQLRRVVSQQAELAGKTLNVNTPEGKSALSKAAKGSGNTSTNPPPKDNTTGKPEASDEQREALKKENDTFRAETREKYGDVRYPLDLSLEFQDCIKFTILKYRPSLSGGKGSQDGIGRVVVIENKNPTIKNADRLGTITLPIPSGINDSNSVNWQEDTINDLQEALGNIGTKYIVGGTDAAKPAVESGINQLEGGSKSGELQQSLAATFAGAATNSDRLQQRAYGSMFNNNLELLFTGPSLRSFSFTFKLSPRSAGEAKEVMKIIRFFKQAMSVKRSKSSLLLKSPHTFAISYLSSNQQHPYLNRFKECALTNVGVDYTPDGQYMTYMSSNVNERSMISYNLSLTFQELEPIFDDEYGAEESDSLKGVGF